jgi:hypothetical protein
MRSWIKRIALLSALVAGLSAGATVFAGCGDDDDGTVTVDSGTVDARVADARVADAGHD